MPDYRELEKQFRADAAAHLRNAQDCQRVREKDRHRMSAWADYEYFVCADWRADLARRYVEAVRRRCEDGTAGKEDLAAFAAAVARDVLGKCCDDPELARHTVWDDCMLKARRLVATDEYLDSLPSLAG